MTTAQHGAPVHVADAPAIPGLSFRAPPPADWGRHRRRHQRAPAAPTASTRSATARTSPPSTPSPTRSSWPATPPGRGRRHASSPSRMGYRVVRDGSLVAETFGDVAPDSGGGASGRRSISPSGSGSPRSCADDPRPGRASSGPTALEARRPTARSSRTTGTCRSATASRCGASSPATLPDHPLPAGLEMRPRHRGPVPARSSTPTTRPSRTTGATARPRRRDFTARFHGPEMDPSIWCVAWDGDQVAGVVMNAIFAEENAELGVQRGWLEHVSVRRPWRGRGVAKALCAASFRLLREQGMDEAWLGVDGANPTGALQLYEGLGFGASALDGVRAAAGPAGARGLDSRPGADPAGAGPGPSERQPALVPDQLHPRPLPPDRGRGAVPGQHPQRVVQAGQPGDRADHRLGRRRPGSPPGPSRRGTACRR